MLCPSALGDRESHRALPHQPSGPPPHSAWLCGWAAPPAPRGPPGAPRHRPPDASVPSSAARGGTTGSAREGPAPATRGSAWGAARRTTPAGTQADGEDRPCGPSRSPRRPSAPSDDGGGTAEVLRPRAAAPAPGPLSARPEPPRAWPSTRARPRRCQRLPGSVLPGLGGRPGAQLCSEDTSTWGLPRWLCFCLGAPPVWPGVGCVWSTGRRGPS